MWEVKKIILGNLMFCVFCNMSMFYDFSVKKTKAKLFPLNTMKAPFLLKMFLLVFPCIENAYVFQLHTTA